MALTRQLSLLYPHLFFLCGVLTGTTVTNTPLRRGGEEGGGGRVIYHNGLFIQRKEKFFHPCLLFKFNISCLRWSNPSPSGLLNCNIQPALPPVHGDLDNPPLPTRMLVSNPNHRGIIPLSLLPIPFLFFFFVSIHLTNRPSTHPPYSYLRYHITVNVV